MSSTESLGGQPLDDVSRPQANGLRSCSIMALEPESGLAKPALAETRRAVITEMLRDSGSVTVAELEERFGISAMTARRDLTDLVHRGIARRTHGGAVLPTMSAH